jgi:hypothetical protein
MRLLRPGSLHVATGVLGILLAALAVQFALNGVGEFVRLREAGRALEGNFHAIVGDAYFDTTLSAH